jgi:Ca2+-binding EF-hand superfamily protein
MFGKITTLVIVGFVALTKAESNLFSLFKAQAAAAETPAIENAESLSSNNWTKDTNDIMTVCDSNRSGLITYSEAITCGGTSFWDLVKPFDYNRDGMLSRSEIYAAVQYYHTNNWASLKTITEENGKEIPDFNVAEVQSFLSANVFAGLETLISQKTLRDVDQMFLALDSNRDGKITKYELQTAARTQGQVIYDSQINPFFEVVDTNRDGGISKNEFVTFLQSPSQWTTLVFKYVDTNRDGYINLYELTQFVKTNTPAGQKVPTDAEVRQVFVQLDFNRDGRIAWNELYQIMQALQQQMESQH